jgi:EAL domain-containing protein (putative c-di-GMP-specific phosphodiesterase class I)
MAKKKNLLDDVDVSPLAFATGKRDAQTLDMVREAVSHAQALLAFQPVVLAHDGRTIAFQEGLIRILDATGRIIPAADFIDVIENTDLGRQIDVLSLRKGLKTLYENQALRLSINMSARSIGYRPWMQALNHWIKKDPTIGERLILEMTEQSVMLVPDLVADFMQNLQMKGVCFAMDQFGTGLIGLRYFIELDFDIAKIDGQFIRGIATDPDKRLLTSALMGIAATFEMLTVAEKVENPEDLATLQDMGVDCAQGYYFAAPTTRPDWLHMPGSKRAG